MVNNNLYLQASAFNLDLTTQQEVSVSPVRTPLVITATTSLVSLAIGVASTLSVIGRWYVKFIPLFRKLFPDTFKSDLDEWLENLVYKLVLRDEDIRKETNPDELRTILKDTNTVVDLIKLDPEEISDYLHTKASDIELSLESELNHESDALSEIEKEANRLVEELEDLHEVDVN
jgi:hypothetical protein